MDYVIYVASDGTGMTSDDLITWLRSTKESSSHYLNWDFDCLTGGVDEFSCPKAYLEAKSFFEKL